MTRTVTGLSDMDPDRAKALIEHYSGYDIQPSERPMPKVVIEDVAQDQDHVFEGVWYILQTNIKCELRAKADLEASGINAYLPMARKEFKHHRNKKWITREFPVFNRYMFIELDKTYPRWFDVRRANGVESVLGVDGRPMPVDPSSVQEIMDKQAVGAFDIMRKTKSRLKPGQRVKIESGPLTGLYGEVTRESGRKTVHIIAEMLANRIPVEIPIALVSKEG